MNEKDFIFMLQKLIEFNEDLLPKKIVSTWDEGFTLAVYKINARIQKDIDLLKE